MGMSLIEIIYFLIAIAVVMSFHEASHALVAYYLGDPTAKLYGRLTLNPLKHFDLFGFLMLIFVHFGWGKPVPVNPSNFNKPVRDSAIVSLAGPLSNFVLAFAFALPMRYLHQYLPGFVMSLLWYIFDLSVVWGIFNLLPFPPLDGAKILGFLVPRKWHESFMKFQEKGVIYFILFVLFDMMVLKDLVGFSLIQYVVMGIYEVVRGAMLFGM
jgi:Zn-dependent protease